MFKYIDQLGQTLYILTPIFMIATYIFSLKIRNILPYAITIVILIVSEIFYSSTIENPNLKRAYEVFFNLEILLVTVSFSIYFLVAKNFKKDSKDEIFLISCCVLGMIFAFLCFAIGINEIEAYEKDMIEQIVIESPVIEESLSDTKTYFRYEANV